MRLIDADALIERKFILHDMEELTHEEFEKLVNEQPTAYDAEKVVAELDKSSFLMEPRTEGHYADNGVFLDDAIEIVRKGGVS